MFNEFRSVIEWKNPNEKEIFIKFKNENGEIKNTSKLILQVGQGAILTYEGKIEEVLLEEGIYDLKTSNIPFITKLKKFLELRNRSEHILGIWFFRKADIVNMRWGTAVPIAYNDPFYTFPILLSAFGNYSIKITKPVEFFTNIVAGKNLITSFEVKEIFLSRITQPITDYLANAKFSYVDIDSNLNNIATNLKEKSREIFEGLGFELLDFRIEGTQFDKETLDRINEVSEVQADVKSSSIAGIDYVEMQKLKALKDAAKNQGSIGVLTGVNLIQNTNAEIKENKKDIKSKLLKLKELLDLDLISKEEFDEKKKKLLEEF
ncbi:MAG: SPFH domain-containing protein [Fusobacterium sp.]|nr:SPFH domain-containing protein [Fusobacterium sp.]